ncbi:hypothetical protein IJG91_00110 [Candidatus Saccharibacteria bacterium]|nr:hypothetical protein [Candidatus Saccharibacteria bacterium]
MKKAKLLIAAMFMAVTLGLPAKAVFAAAITITQADLATACSGTPTKGITCSTTDERYTLAAGEYVLGSDLDLGTYNLGLSGAGNYILNLGNHVITSAVNTAKNSSTITVVNSGKTTAIKNGKIANTGMGGGTALSIGGSIATISDVTLSSNADTAEINNFGTTAANVTFNNVVSNKHINVMGDSTLTINSGTYSGDMMGAVSTSLAFDPITFEYNDDGGHLIINGGTFASAASSAIYANGIGKKASVEINGGSFTSEGDTGMEVLGAKSVKVTGGTFTGKEAGLRLAEYTSVVLSGGTYKATGTEVDNGAITMLATNESKLSTLLAAGYKYTDGAAAMGTLFGEPLAYLTSKNVSVVSTSTSTNDETNTEDTTSSNTIGAPDSGRNTKETSATTSALVSILASSVLLGGIYAGKKHFAKKQA